MTFLKFLIGSTCLYVTVNNIYRCYISMQSPMQEMQKFATYATKSFQLPGA